MNEGFQTFVDQLDTPACILSVERKETDHRRAIHVIAGNRQYIDTIKKKIPGFNDDPRPFVPDVDYTEYAPQDMNFEQACIQAALYKKKINANVHTDNYDVWFNILFIPLHSDSEELGYCAYVMELSKEPDAAAMSSSANIASDVLETCIKLRSTDNFREAMKLICKDIRDLCDSEHCCFFMVDTHDRKCSVLCEALSDNTELLSMEAYVDDAFYAIAESWEATIAGSNCLIIRDEHDMEIVRKRNPVWIESITNAGGKNIVLFPMKYKGELLGYLWAINFSAEKADIIKETLELTTFILASEIYSNNIIEHLHILSSSDMLTGVMNRNEMNNFVIELVEGRHKGPVGVLFADLNGLKNINDAEGHKAGDTLLKNAASALKEVFPADRIFRAGGDEFVVIMTGITVDELHMRTEELRRISANYPGLVFAVGMAYESDPVNVRTALHNADEYMYADKKNYYKQHPDIMRVGGEPRQA